MLLSGRVLPNMHEALGSVPRAAKKIKSVISNQKVGAIDDKETE